MGDSKQSGAVLEVHVISVLGSVWGPPVLRNSRRNPTGWQQPGVRAWARKPSSSGGSAAAAVAEGSGERTGLARREVLNEMLHTYIMYIYIYVHNVAYIYIHV